MQKSGIKKKRKRKYTLTDNFTAKKSLCIYYLTSYRINTPGQYCLCWQLTVFTGAAKAWASSSTTYHTKINNKGGKLTRLYY